MVCFNGFVQVWIGAVRGQDITWANVDPDLWRHCATVIKSVTPDAHHWSYITDALSNHIESSLPT